MGWSYKKPADFSRSQTGCAPPGGPGAGRFLLGRLAEVLAALADDVSGPAGHRVRRTRPYVVTGETRSRDQRSPAASSPFFTPQAVTPRNRSREHPNRGCAAARIRAPLGPVQPLS